MSYRAITGHDRVCCGLTRAFACAAHGEWSAASACNAAWPVAVAMWAALTVLACLDAVRAGDRVDRVGGRLARRLGPIALLLAGATAARLALAAFTRA